MSHKKRCYISLTNRNINGIDIAKGFLILLVVFGHAWRALYNNEILQNTSLFHLIDNWIYSFHMPAFFFISGLFAMQSSEQLVKVFIWKKVRTIAYPYFLWSLIQSLLQLFMSKSTTTSITWGDIAKIPFQPVMQFWFLYALFFIFLFFIICKQLTNSPFMLFFVGIILFLIIRAGYLPSFLPSIYLANNFIYFSGGLVCSKLVLKIKFLELYDWRIAILTITVIILSVCIALNTNNISPGARLWIAPLFSIPGITLIFLLSFLLQSSNNYSPYLFSYIGQHSLEIFVTHTIFSAAYRIIIFKTIGITSLSIHLVGATFVGIAGPLLLIRLASYFKIHYLFSFPSHSPVKGSL